MGKEENPWMIIHTVVVSILICVGLWTNSLFMMSLKANKPKINNNERFQVFKTGLIIMALVVCIPMNLWVIQLGNATFISCVVTGALQNLFLNTYPVGVTAIAIIRFRLATCKGNAAILVKRVFFVSLALGCAFMAAFTSLSFVVFSFLSGEPKSANESSMNGILFCHQILGDTINKFNIGIILLTYVPSSLIVLGLYLQIGTISTSSVRRMQQFPSNNVRRITINAMQIINPINMHERQMDANEMPDIQTRDTKVRQSIRILLSVFFLVTISYTALEIILSLNLSQFTLNVALLYFKVLMCVLHSVGEGTLTSEKRARTRLFLSQQVVLNSNSKMKASNTTMIASNSKTADSKAACMSEEHTCGQNSYNHLKFIHLFPTLKKIKETSAQFCTDSNGYGKPCNIGASNLMSDTPEIPDDKSCHNMTDNSQLFTVRHMPTNFIIQGSDVTDLDRKTALTDNDFEMRKTINASHLSLRSISRISQHTSTSMGRLSRCSGLTPQQMEASDSWKLSSSLQPSTHEFCDALSCDLDPRNLRPYSHQRIISTSGISTCSLVSEDNRMPRISQSSALSSRLRPSIEIICTSDLPDSVFSPTESVFEHNPFCSTEEFIAQSSNGNTAGHSRQVEQVYMESLETNKFQDDFRTLSVLSDNM